MRSNSNKVNSTSAYVKSANKEYQILPSDVLAGPYNKRVDGSGAGLLK